MAMPTGDAGIEEQVKWHKEEVVGPPQSMGQSTRRSGWLLKTIMNGIFLSVEEVWD